MEFIKSNKYLFLLIEENRENYAYKLYLEINCLREVNIVLNRYTNILHPHLACKYCLPYN